MCTIWEKSKVERTKLMKKKLVSLVLLFVMVFTLALPVSAADMEAETRSSHPYFPIYSISVAGAYYDNRDVLQPATNFYTTTYTIANLPSYILPSAIRNGYDGYIVIVKAYCGGSTIAISDYRGMSYGIRNLPGSTGSLAQFTVEVPDFTTDMLFIQFQSTQQSEKLNGFRLVRNQQ